MRAGVYQVAFEDEIGEGVSPLDVGPLTLMAVRMGERVAIADAACPHFGANLAYGGVPEQEGSAVRCPFHKKLIRVGDGHGPDFCVRTYPSATTAGGLYVSFGEAGDRGFVETLRDIELTHFCVAAFSLVVSARPEWVIGNGFDGAHFMPVHRVLKPVRLEIVEDGHCGPLVAVGMFRLPSSVWQKTADGGPIDVPYRTMAFSPGVVLSHMGGEFPYWVLTAATPKKDRTVRVFVTLLLPHDRGIQAPDPNRVRYLVNGVRAGLASDVAIWQHMAHDLRPKLAEEDEALASFLAFCEHFPLIAAADA
jgi:nitrite reductase/ring-hydroxylating ferredoxin subunit